MDDVDPFLTNRPRWLLDIIYKKKWHLAENLHAEPSEESGKYNCNGFTVSLGSDTHVPTCNCEWFCRHFCVCKHILCVCLLPTVGLAFGFGSMWAQHPLLTLDMEVGVHVNQSRPIVKLPQPNQHHPLLPKYQKPESNYILDEVTGVVYDPDPSNPPQPIFDLNADDTAVFTSPVSSTLIEPISPSNSQPSTSTEPQSTSTDNSTSEHHITRFRNIALIHLKNITSHLYQINDPTKMEIYANHLCKLSKTGESFCPTINNIPARSPSLEKQNPTARLVGSLKLRKSRKRKRGEDFKKAHTIETLEQAAPTPTLQHLHLQQTYNSSQQLYNKGPTQLDRPIKNKEKI